MAKLGPMTDARSKKKQNKKRKITPVTGARKKAIIKRYKTSHLPASFRGANIFARTIKKTHAKQALLGEPSYSLFKPVIRKFPRRKVVIGAPNYQLQCDLLNVSNYAKENKGIKYLLCVVDCFSRYAWVRPLVNKEMATVSSAFDNILKSMPSPPFYLQSDKGCEFTGRDFKNVLKKYGVRYFSTENDDIKASLVERFQRTLQQTLHRFFEANASKKYANSLQKLVKSYNLTFHRTLQMSPTQALTANKQELWYNIYYGPSSFGRDKELIKKRRRSDRVNSQLRPGDAVRISDARKAFAKGYLGHWSREIFSVDTVNNTVPITYKIRDAAGELIRGSFYKQELALTEYPEFYDVEKVLATRQRDGKTEYFVKWLGYPDHMNSWTGDIGVKKSRRR